MKIHTVRTVLSEKGKRGKRENILSNFNFFKKTPSFAVNRKFIQLHGPEAKVSFAFHLHVHFIKSLERETWCINTNRTSCDVYESKKSSLMNRQTFVVFFCLSNKFKGAIIKGILSTYPENAEGKLFRLFLYLSYGCNCTGQTIKLCYEQNILIAPPTVWGSVPCFWASRIRIH
jgi:hypothetical protein